MRQKSEIRNKHTDKKAKKNRERSKRNIRCNNLDEWTTNSTERIQLNRPIHYRETKSWKRQDKKDLAQSRLLSMKLEDFHERKIAGKSDQSREGLDAAAKQHNNGSTNKLIRVKIGVACANAHGSEGERLSFPLSQWRHRREGALVRTVTSPRRL